MLTLANLDQRIKRGGRWWSAVPAVGEAKARRIAESLRLLLPPETTATTAPLQPQLRKCPRIPVPGGAVIS